MATATKKQPKAKKENKSALIRDYAKAHRTATAKQIAEKLGCSEGLVHAVRNKMKRGRKKAKHSGQIAMYTNGAVPTESTPAEVCVTFVRAAGGFAEAKKMLLTAETFSGLKIR